MKNVCIFCASSSKVPQSYCEAAQKTTEILVDNGWGIVYGGGSVGLMGVVADTTLLKNGNIVGVIPQFMIDVEWQHCKVADMRTTTTMSERKQIMMDLADAILILPGGTGTMDEMFEAIANKKLGLHNKPIVLLNTDGFFDGTIAQLKRMVNDMFMTQKHLDVISIAETPQDVMPLLNIESQHINLSDAQL